MQNIEENFYSILSNLPWKKKQENPAIVKKRQIKLLKFRSEQPILFM